MNRNSLNPISFLFRSLFAAAMPMHAFDPNDPADKAAVQKLIDEAVEGLKTSRDQILAENKRLKKGAEVKPEDVEKLENELEATKTQLGDAQKALKTAQKAADDATKALEGERGYNEKLLIDNALTSALTEAGVKDPVYIKAAAALVRAENKFEIKADGADRFAFVGDKKLADFVKEWSQGDSGKAFVSAPGNSGGNAGGSGKPSVPNPWGKDTFNLTEQGRILQENPTMAASLQAQAAAAT